MPRFLAQLSWVAVSAAPVLAQGFQPPAVPPRQPIIPASVAPLPDLRQPQIGRPLTADPRFQPAPQSPAEPRPLPPHLAPPAAGPSPQQGPTDWNPQEPSPDVPLPQKEQAVRFEGSGVTIRKFQDGWQVWSGHVMLRDFGRAQADAEEAVKVIRELRPTEWVTIGPAGRPTLEYALMNGKPHMPTFSPKLTAPIDLRTVRVENVRGVWCLRDDATILVNFGREKADAEQSLAVIRKYGFNRLGLVGNPSQMTVLFAQPGLTPGLTAGPKAGPGAPPAGLGQLARVAQEQNLTRTGIELPGSGYVGERVVIDAKKLEVKKDRGEYVLAHGTDVLAKFGLSDWSARDALRVLQEMRVTEFCRFNADVTFFLVNGQPPARVPFAVQGSRFDPQRLSVKPASAGQFGVYETNGRLLFSVPTKGEAESLVTLLRHYGFDQQCQVGLSGRNGLKFLAKAGR